MGPKELTAESKPPGTAETATTRPGGNKEGLRSRSPAYRRKAEISIALVDQKSLTRECIIKSLRALDDRLAIKSFSKCDEILQGMADYDLIIYYAHGGVENHGENHHLLVLKKILEIAPVIILSDSDRPDCVIEMVESGVRGFIPTADTTLDQINRNHSIRDSRRDFRAIEQFGSAKSETARSPGQNGCRP